jgi:hypothetical protein
MIDGSIQFIVEDPARAEAKIDEKGYIVLEQFKPRA